jgi:osmoprotectant transport system permease protein
VSVLEWLFAAEHWSGENGVPIRLLQHVELSAAGLALAILVAVPVGAVVGHTRRGAGVSVSIANLGRAIPSFAILVLVFIAMLRWWPGLAFGFGPTVVALTLLAIPPILTNTSVAIRDVDADTVEAARGMGMRGTQILRSLEFPLAAPVIVTGIRIAAVQVVATATLAALIAGGGLGRYIVDGFAQGDRTMTTAGAVLVALLAIATDVVFGAVARVASPMTSSQPTGGHGRTLDAPAADAAGASVRKSVRW